MFTCACISFTTNETTSEMSFAHGVATLTKVALYVCPVWIPAFRIGPLLTLPRLKRFCNVSVFFGLCKVQWQMHIFVNVCLVSFQVS